MPAKVMAVNKKARYEYHIVDTFETGIVLTGTEVKSLRAGKANLQDSYARVENGELLLYNMHIAQYQQGNRFNHEPKRVRKLLVHKREILRLIGYTKEKGLTLIPLKVFFNDRGWVKVEMATARGKKSYDKRQDIAAREAKREVERAVKGRQ
ncbi:SsrA-binding protein [Peptococcaceae bacterium SCADC1_2_3]|jgi:SsrA-binding protein|nr:SsrA-binding protein [Peptococcaceae bacterium SCADC1_2_3]KFI37361.1 SsrA-binding protein [Peptococcaceae bacterium SCADC1_2_3]HBQ29335.1 SsrA-binding protein SmpB [Desulfotomaculum sp.]HCJ79120.1 SsrA-binding protein SmpB [Desulfotomaculum sp.]